MPLTGVWVNEHKSIMVIAEDSDGGLTGTYRSLIGRDTRKRPLSGRASSEEVGKQLLGFTVCFQIENPAEGTGHHSLCTWSGWARRKEITTNWLLTTSVLDPKDEWSSTRLGQDTFERVVETANAEYLDSDEEMLNRLLADARK
jgi:avidin family protein